MSFFISRDSGLQFKLINVAVSSEEANTVNFFSVLGIFSYINFEAFGIFILGVGKGNVWFTYCN